MPRMVITPEPKISVVVPHLNEPEGLLRCLTALCDQRADGVPFEVIVVDNGSHSRPQPICDRFADVHLVDEAIPGPGPARNRGAIVARGEIIAFIDADCIAEPGWFAGIAAFFEVHADVDFIGGAIGVTFADPAKPTALEAYERIYSYRMPLYVARGYTATGNMAVRKSVFEAVGPFGGITTMEDTAWGQRATALGYTVGYAPDVRVATPACHEFTELARRWNRHISHEFAGRRGSLTDTAAWLAKALAVLGSPAAELVPLARSHELPGVRSRTLAFIVLVRLRFYRAGRMLGLVLRDDAAATLKRWNRADAPTSTRHVECPAEEPS